MALVPRNVASLADPPRAPKPAVQFLNLTRTSRNQKGFASPIFENALYPLEKQVHRATQKILRVALIISLLRY